MDANSTVEGPARNAKTARTVTARNVVTQENSFWVLYRHHTKPTHLENAGDGQQAQRNAALAYVKQWRVCLDIGSHVGEWTRPLAKRFHSVICFEPNPNFRECFTKNITERNVILWPYGLSDKEHRAQQDFNSTVLKEGEGDIECRTLDSFGLTNLDFIKIDVDGFEVPLLNGARGTLSNNNAVINIEMKRRKRPEICSKAQRILESLGYRQVSRVRSDEVWLKSL